MVTLLWHLDWATQCPDVWIILSFFLFGCAGSLLLYVWAFSSCSSGACSLVVVHRLPLWWLLLLWTWALGHASFRSLQLMGLAALPHMESSLTGNWTCVPCIGRRILNLWITREVLFFSAMLHGLWDFSSPAKEWTQALGYERVDANHWNAREFS